MTDDPSDLETVEGDVVFEAELDDFTDTLTLRVFRFMGEKPYEKIRRSGHYKLVRVRDE